MKRLVVISVLLLALILAGCTEKTSDPVDPDPSVRQLTQAEQTLTDGSNTFGYKIFSALCADEPDSNIFISPLSISTALSMAINGARGETHDAMVATLEIIGLTDDEINSNYETLTELLTTIDTVVTFEIANSVWCRDDFNPNQSFLDKLARHYDAGAEKLDFGSPAALETINNWVDEKTHGRIPKIINNIERDIVMYLINAIYFNALWTEDFDPELTMELPFTLSDGSTMNCQMMTKGEIPVEFFENDDVKAVRLPYGNENYHFIAVLPKQVTPDDLAATLTDDVWSKWMDSFTETEINLGIPKLQLSYGNTLDNILKAMGMGIAFTPQADFCNIDSLGGLYISEVVHKSFLKIDEEGTEATAVTSVGFGRIGGPVIPNFFASNPFLFAIWKSNSNSILFLGKIEKPVFDE